MNSAAFRDFWCLDPRRLVLFFHAAAIRSLWKLRELCKLLRVASYYRPALDLPPLVVSARPKKALVVYASEAFHDKAFETQPPHQFYILSQRFVEVLRSQGYHVDVADIRDPGFSSQEDYSLIISHDATLSETRVPACRTAYRVYFASGLCPISQNRNVLERERLFRERRRSQNSIDLRLAETSIPFAESAHLLLALENEFAPNDWRTVFGGELRTVKNVALPSLTEDFIAKPETESSRPRILFAASSGQLLKGLDLVLEAAVLLPECEFTICSSFLRERGFLKEYWRELFCRPNVLPLGWLPPYSRIFREVLESHDFFLLPSCSEGSCGTVVHLGSNGLLPIVTKSTGIDISDFGVWIDEITPAGIVAAIQQALSIPKVEREARQVRAREFMRSNFNTEQFDREVQEIVQHAETWRREQDDERRSFGGEL